MLQRGSIISPLKIVQNQPAHSLTILRRWRRRSTAILWRRHASWRRWGRHASHRWWRGSHTSCWGGRTRRSTAILLLWRGCHSPRWRLVRWGGALRIKSLAWHWWARHSTWRRTRGWWALRLLRGHGRRRSTVHGRWWTLTHWRWWTLIHRRWRPLTHGRWGTLIHVWRTRGARWTRRPRRTLWHVWWTPRSWRTSLSTRANKLHKVVVGECSPIKGCTVFYHVPEKP
mmetsp:Transcript_19660/g.33818  ORF Transcript_19660/g.33818 Transcript_19660/m.33818 type:complete len:228 (-) Transcript_19660:1589-2272(-)